MYNTEFKQKYLDQLKESESSIKTTRFMFDRLESLENELNLDLCQISDQESLKKVFELVGGIRGSSGSSTISKIKKYIRWCIANNVAGVSDAFLSATFSTDEKFASHMVGSPNDLNEYLNMIFDKEIKKTFDNVFRAYFWLAYIGVNNGVIYELQNSDVNIKERKIKYNGRVYEIYEEAVDSINNCKELDYFMYYHPNYSQDIARPRYKSNQLLRGIKSEAKDSTFRPNVSRTIKKSGNNRILSYENVYLSGIFYRIYEREKDGFPIDFSQVARLFISKSDKYGAIIERTRHLRREYETWKRVFYK